MKAESEVWFQDGVDFTCTQCGYCCTGAPGYVWLKKGEAAAMADYLGISLDDFHRLYTRYVHNAYSLIEYDNGDCVFFDRDPVGCRVYDARPVQCRTYPFWMENLVSKQAWDSESRKCPGMNCGKHWNSESIVETAAANETE